MAARMPQRYNSLVKRLEDGEGGGKARKEDVIETLMELGELEQATSFLRTFLIAAALLLLLCLGATAALIYSTVKLAEELSVSPDGLLTSAGSGAGMRLGGSKFALATAAVDGDVNSYLVARYPEPEYTVEAVEGIPGFPFYSVRTNGPVPAIRIFASAVEAPPATLAALCKQMLAEGQASMVFDIETRDGAYTPFPAAPGPAPSYTLGYRPSFSLGCEPIVAEGGSADVGYAQRVTLRFAAGPDAKASFSCFAGVCDTFSVYTPEEAAAYFEAVGAISAIYAERGGPAGPGGAAGPPAPGPGRRRRAEL